MNIIIDEGLRPMKRPEAPPINVIFPGNADVQNHANPNSIEIDKAGVKNISYPIVVLGKLNAPSTPWPASTCRSTYSIGTMTPLSLLKGDQLCGGHNQRGDVRLQVRYRRCLFTYTL